MLNEGLDFLAGGILVFARIVEHHPGREEASMATAVANLEDLLEIEGVVAAITTGSFRH
jgi:hypothetical protein